MKSNKALLIIDMQKGSFEQSAKRFNVIGVVDRINQLSAYFRKNQAAVVYIQHNGLRDNEFVPNTWQWQILDELTLEPNDMLVEKYANDCFYQSELASLLAKLSVNEVYITGCATDFCVEATIQSALTKDFEVTVVSDGHTTGDRPHLPAAKVIEHYNWVWNNMLPTKGRVNVLNCQFIISQDAQ